MATDYEVFFKSLYSLFNQRNIDAVLASFHPDVHWPNGWEGGYVNGHNEVRDYWTRQWKELNPVVLPVSIQQRADGKVEVEVQQTVKDLQGNLLFDGIVKHVYSFDNGLVTGMEIEGE